MQRAIRLIRSRAKKWDVDTARLNAMGFSAGRELAGLAATHFDEGKENAIDPIDRQSSQPLIYPGNSSRLDVAKTLHPYLFAKNSSSYCLPFLVKMPVKHAIQF